MDAERKLFPQLQELSLIDCVAMPSFARSCPHLASVWMLRSSLPEYRAVRLFVSECLALQSMRVRKSADKRAHLQSDVFADLRKGDQCSVHEMRFVNGTSEKFIAHQLLSERGIEGFELHRASSGLANNRDWNSASANSGMRELCALMLE